MRKVENQNKEFKQAWNDNCLKTICAFANTGGGKLYIGIDDEGKPVGVKDAAKYLDDIPNKTKDILGITPDVKLKKKNGREILEVTVEASSAPISYHGRFYTRIGSSSIEIKGHELLELLMQKSGRSWDGFIEERATLKDIDPAAIRKFRELAAAKIPQIVKEKSVEAILQKLNLLDKGKLRRAAVLLFGKNPKQFYITAYIKIGKFVSATDLISTDDIEGNLFDQVDKAIEILRIKYLLSNITYEGIYRKDNMEYPEEALREAIINAVIHRNYMGAHTQLRIDPESLNLWNEGGLPPGIGVADLKKWHLSRPRNELLADVFFKAGMIEAWGRGTIKIVDECKKAGLPEPEFREQFGGLSVHFRKGKSEKKVGGELGDGLGERLGETEKRILTLIAGNKFISIPAMAKNLNISTTAVEKHLKKLKSKGAIVRVGSARGGAWRINGEIDFDNGGNMNKTRH